jgi:hypothetical protein
VPATLPQLLRLNCLHAIAAPRLAPRKPHHLLQPRAQLPQPTSCKIINVLPAFASSRSQRGCGRCTQRTTEAQQDQLRHPSDTRCQRRCPIISDPIFYTPPPPSARPSQSPALATAPAQPPQPTTCNDIYELPAFASSRSQRSCRRCTQAYHRAQATSAASSFRESVQETLPQLLRCNCLHARPALGWTLANPATCSSPARNRHSQQHATSSTHRRRWQASAHSAAAADAHKRTMEVQRPQQCQRSETRCQRRCSSCSDMIACTPRRPSAAPRKPHHPLQPRVQSPQPTTRCPCKAGVRKLPLTELRTLHAAYG